jgi:mRNA interferase MazF
MVRGECVRLRSPRDARGGVQKGERYGVIVQSDLINLNRTVLVVPTSASARPASFRPKLELPDGPTYALTEQTRAVDREAVGEPVGRLSASEMLAMEQAMKLVLGLVGYSS